MANKHIIGIDLGTTTTLVARFNEAGKSEITNNSEGSAITPSVIQLDSSGDVIVGTEAKKFLGTGVTNVIAEFKREMGTDKSWLIDNKNVTPIQLSALLLKKVVADYAEQFGQPDTVVITWPANYRNEQREATKEAAKRATVYQKKVKSVLKDLGESAADETEKQLEKVRTSLVTWLEDAENKMPTHA
jgi:molecular chaperone DnaK